MSNQSAVFGEIHTAFLTHEYGCDYYAAPTRAALLASLAGFCREHWDAERVTHRGLPEVPPADDAETIEAYFAAVSEETHEIGSAALTPIANPHGLSAGELADAYGCLGQLTRIVLRQRGELAGEQLRRVLRRVTSASTESAAAARMTTNLRRRAPRRR
jgi:hypothetical protein